MRVDQKINIFLTKRQSNRWVRVNRPLQCIRRAVASIEGRKFPGRLHQTDYAIDRETTVSTGSSGIRRPCEAFSNWRTRTAGTGRLNR
jgi:hypothetical protein